MNKPNTVTLLLAVIAALLGMNLIAKTSPAAVGQSQAGTPPVAVSMSITNNGSLAEQVILRLWSDGQVDETRIQISCPSFPVCAPNVIIPGTCAADIDRTGDVAVNDLLEVLGGWGECP